MLTAEEHDAAVLRHALLILRRRSRRRGVWYRIACVVLAHLREATLAGGAPRVRP